MLDRMGVALAALIVFGGAARADQMCGDPPIAPALPSAADMRTKAPQSAAAARHQAYLDVRTWQSVLKTYRACLIASVKTNQRAALDAQRASKPDADKIAGLQKEIAADNHAYDASVDDEERLVNDFHALQVAYCLRTDVDRSSCPKT